MPAADAQNETRDQYVKHRQRSKGHDELFSSSHWSALQRKFLTSLAIEPLQCAHVSYSDFIDESI